jgi:membrane-bound metal-dependent hydrolase YbcI (DUF457 family)
MEPLLHVVLPFVALVLLGLEPQKALPLGLLGILPDLDVIFLIHRSISHSTVVTILLAAPILLYVWYKKPGYRSYALLGLMAVLSHQILDLFNGYTPILWPLSQESYWMETILNGRIGSEITLQPILEIYHRPTVFQTFSGLDAPIFTSEGLAITLTLLLPIAYTFIKEEYG